MMESIFLYSKNTTIKSKNRTASESMCYEDGQPFPIHISKETFKDQMNLLLITKDEKKHYVQIKDFKGQLQHFHKLSLFDRFRHVENGFDINF